MATTRLAALAFGCWLLGSAQAEALILLEGFEGGLPAGSILAPGSVGGTSGAVPNLAPTEGLAFGFLDTTGSTPIPGGTAGSLLLLPAFALADGDVLLLDLNFLTNDGNGFNDFAVAQLVASGTLDLIATLYTADTTGAGIQSAPCLGCPAGAISPGVILSPSPAFLDGVATGPLSGTTYGPDKFGGGAGGATGWVTSAFMPGAGSYQLAFAVSDVDDTRTNSALAVDDIRVDSGSQHGPIIPEPDSLLLLSAGLVGLFAARRLQRRHT